MPLPGSAKKETVDYFSALVVQQRKISAIFPHPEDIPAILFKPYALWVGDTS